MLGRMSNGAQCKSPEVAISNDIYQRDEKEDFKTAIDYLYEFKKKLSTLHPSAQWSVEHLLQHSRNF